MIVTDAQARAHLRIDSDEDIAVYIGAAERMAVEFLNRNVYADQTEMDDAILDGVAGESPIIADDLIRAGVLLILGHLYANREDAVVGVSATELPMSSRYVLQPYRKCMGV